MNWDSLNMSQKNDLIRIYLKNGITSLDGMKKHYNSFAEGGNIDDPPTGKTKRPNLKDTGRLLGQFVGLPTMVKSSYVPTIAKNNNAVYYTYPNLKSNVLNNMASQGRMPWESPLDMSNFSNLYNDIISKQDKQGRYSRNMAGTGLGGYTIGTGEDAKGKYISIYDRYNFGWLPFSDGQEIYDRIYEEDFNKFFAQGGKLDIPPFAKRYSEGQRRAIPTSKGPATHYMAVNEADGKYYAYPTVQPINYNDTNSPLKYYGDRAFDRALENNDVMEFNLLDDAIRYSENYKRPPSTGAFLNTEESPLFSPYDYINSFSSGGKIFIKPEKTKINYSSNKI